MTVSTNKASVPAEIRVYTYSSDNQFKQADLDIQMKDGFARLSCFIEVDEQGNAQASTLSFADLGTSEFVFRGSCSESEIFLKDTGAIVSDNVYPFLNLKQEYQTEALFAAGFIIHSCKINNDFGETFVEYV